MMDMKNSVQLGIFCLAAMILLAHCSGSDKSITVPELGDDLPLGDTSRTGPVGRTPSAEATPVGARPSTSAPDGWTLVIADTLTGGTTQGLAEGGVFLPGQGYHIPDNWGGYLAYATSIDNPNLMLEFDAQGYLSYESDGGGGKMILFRITDTAFDTPWTGGGTEWDTNSLFELRKKGAEAYDPDGVHLKFGSRGNFSENYRSVDGYSPAGHPLSWNVNTTYHWVVTIASGAMEITRNGQTIFVGACDEFQPFTPLNILIGGTPSAWSGPRDVTYANVKVYQRATR